MVLYKGAAVFFLFYILSFGSPPGISGVPISSQDTDDDSEPEEGPSRSSDWDRLPVIGVLLQGSKYIPAGTTHVLAQYVKWLQAGGANVIPIRGDQPDSYYEDITSKINGVLFPGGGRNLRDSPYAKAARKIFQLAMEYNDAGSYFPLWGTCLGFEMMAAIHVDQPAGDLHVGGLKYSVLAQCDAKEYMIPLNLTKDFRSSRLFATMDPALVKAISEEDITANQHKFCVPTEFHKSNQSLNSFYKIISTNVDRNGFDFVSTMEANDYPFYGVQWHVERNIFGMGYRHKELFSSNSVRIGQHFTNFLVDEARRSDHRYSSRSEERHTLIDNHHPISIPSQHYMRLIERTLKCLGEFHPRLTTRLTTRLQNHQSN